MGRKEIARIFREIADLLELQGIAFKPQAYRRAAASIDEMEGDIGRILEEGRVEDIPGVGKAMAAKIREIEETGDLEYLHRLRESIPAGLVELMRIPDVGPRTAMTLHKELGVESIDQLKEAIGSHRVRGVKGFGEKMEERIMNGIQLLESSGGRTLLGEALPIAEAFADHLRDALPGARVSLAGSLRRGKETIGDIDILVSGADPSKASGSFVGYRGVERVLASGSTKSSVVLANGMQADLRVVETESHGAALQYFTGSKEHNVAMRRMGVERGLKLNEYGLFERGSDRLVAGADEEGIYAALDLPWIPPEMREDRGEIEAAARGELPALVTREAIRGDLHMHSEWSDGSDTVEALARAASGMGHSYIAITDHSQGLHIANGLSPERVERQIQEIRRTEDALDRPIRVLAGLEVEIMKDGSLDMPRPLLEELDIVIGSVHSHLRMDPGEQVQRVVTAIRSGQMDILAHPTGRLIGRREPSLRQLDEVFGAAADSGVALELNSFPDRLDLDGGHCRLAKEAGAKISIGTDSHSVQHLAFIRLGLLTARRGWLEASDIINTLSADNLLAHLGGRRS
jgi:DNA polymerase (family 10)